ncbi:hypothetical protein QLS71_013360 [Mariniflexile litorale]|uniref:Uncharacterized protein n=1 Tax=Mariniflexile litorale TaxID=3045158 RepID=A0AAU7ECZ6_9FLAO|nr:hypothetical protein [Mariniflexile sp. KMM 9835]MDQ8212153.1 hypothetical protein [Mariniflexile sp. KMM 9835]
MQKTKEHIAYKTLTLLIALLLLAPIATKFAHIFAHHKHDICLGEKSTHLHEINTDCDFYKFKLSHSYTITFFNVELIVPKENSLEIVSQYQFLSKFQRLQTTLRGPPSLI